MIFYSKTELPGPSLRPLGQTPLVKSPERFPGPSRPTVVLVDGAQQTKTTGRTTNKIKLPLPYFAVSGLVKAKSPKIAAPELSVQMIRARGVKVKEFVLNGCFGRLFGTKSPVNGLPKWSQNLALAL